MLAGLPLISKEQEKGDSIVMKSFCHKHGPRFCFRGRWVIEPKKTFVEQIDVQEGALPAADVVQQLLASVIEHQRWLHLQHNCFPVSNNVCCSTLPPLSSARGCSATAFCPSATPARISTPPALRRRLST
jgi:hypothetical protein